MKIFISQDFSRKRKKIVSKRRSWALYFKVAQGSRETRPGAHVGANIDKIFEQFYKYAVDIDNGVAYTQRAYDIAEAQGNYFVSN